MGKFPDELTLLVRGRYRLIYVVSHEKERVDRWVREIGKRLGKNVYEWASTGGFARSVASASDARDLQGVEVEREQSTREPAGALDFIASDSSSALFVLHDFHAFLTQPEVVRRLRDLVSLLRRSPKTVIVLAPCLTLPTELEKDTVVVEVPLPDASELTFPFDVQSTEPQVSDVGRPARSPGLQADWTVYLMAPSPPKPGSLAKLIASKTGETLHDIKRRLRSSRGIVADKLDRVAADELLTALRTSGFEARCLPSSASFLPRCAEAVEAAWTTDSIAFRLRGGDMHDCPWRRILVVAAYVLFERAGYEDVEVPPAWDEGCVRWERRPLPPRPVRHVAFVVGGSEVESTLWITVRNDVTRFPAMGAGSFTRLGEECASRRDIPVVGDGVFDLARRGSLREYEFADRLRLSEYLKWLVFRARAEDTRTRFLE
ncbi:MAG: hypothetical protein AB7O52_16280 [Planctomycetota bacterium]